MLLNYMRVSRCPSVVMGLTLGRQVERGGRFCPFGAVGRRTPGGLFGALDLWSGERRVVSCQMVGGCLLLHHLDKGEQSGYHLGIGSVGLDKREEIMPKVTPAEFADKWKRRISAATQDVRTGVERVTVAPTEAAAAKREKMQQRLMEAIASGKWEAGLRRVTLQDWRDAMINKGIGRISAGAEQATRKVEDFAAELLPYIEQGQRAIANLPDVTIEDSINRVGAFLRHMHDFRRTGRPRGGA